MSVPPSPDPHRRPPSRAAGAQRRLLRRPHAPGDRAAHLPGSLLPPARSALQIHVRTARRLLARLAADGYIEQTFDDRRRYRATLRLAALGAQVIAHAQLPRIATPFVANLHAQTGIAAHLIIPSYHCVACIVHCHAHHKHAPPEPMLRELLPAHATARRQSAAGPSPSRGVTASWPGRWSATPTTRSPPPLSLRSRPERSARADRPSRTANTARVRPRSQHRSSSPTRFPPRSQSRPIAMVSLAAATRSSQMSPTPPPPSLAPCGPSAAPPARRLEHEPVPGGDPRRRRAA